MTRKVANKILRSIAEDYGYKVRFVTRGQKHYATFRPADGTPLDHASAVKFRKLYLPAGVMTSYGTTFTVRLNP